MEITPEIQNRLDLLNDKYASMGQDLLSYLDGLLHADVTTYWDYIELETLLSLQKPKTKFPDELVFIISSSRDTYLYLQVLPSPHSSLKTFNFRFGKKLLNGS